MTSQKNFFFFAFRRFEYHISVEHNEIPPQPKYGRNQSLGPKIWPHEYLISPSKISVNWNSCGHITGPHEPIHVKFGV